MTSNCAIKLAKSIEKYNPFWIEEPVPPNNIDAMSKVANNINIPVATGERLTTKYEFNDNLKK